MNIPLITLIIVFILIAVRQIGDIRIRIWQVMAMGAGVVILTGQISPRDAVYAVNLDVILFLFGMFVIGQALEESGYLAHISYKYFKRARSVDALMIFILFGFGFASAVLMNDTLAIIGTPVVLLLARKHKMSPKMLLLALAFSITIGSAVSPIGNPQNLLIALNGKIRDPFVEFFKWLFIPTVLNLFVAYMILRIYYKNDFHDTPLSHSQEPIRNHDLAFLSKLSLQMVLVLIAIKIITVIFSFKIEFRLTYIALASALPILIGSPLRWKIVRKIDWSTLAFFAAMFILMESVWLTGFFQNLIESSNMDVTSTFSILSISVILSQFISNVPMVALYQPLLLHTGITTNGFMALAAGSTIAGNLFILGAASNVIIIQNAEEKSHHTLTFTDFAAIGLPLTVINIVIYWIFL
ncbi:MAG: anion transporter [Bacteroidetes bacterium]|nr:anion transporter [Bacteroidota bacterium]